MKKFALILFLPLIFLLSRCGINKQVEQAKALGKCHFDLVSVDSINLSGININRSENGQEINLNNLPRLAMGLLSRNIPFRANVALRITNETGQTAAIDQFEYKILLRNNEIFNGFVNRKVVVPAGGGQIIVPIHVFANVYKLIADQQTSQAFGDLISNLSGSTKGAKSVVTFKVRPTIDLGGKAFNYPGYISFDKEFGR
jgi:hypothetical protein